MNEEKEMMDVVCPCCGKIRQERNDMLQDPQEPCLACVWDDNAIEHLISDS